MLNLPTEAMEKAEKHSSTFVKIIKDALKPKNEPILLITDTGIEQNLLAPMLAHAYCHAAKSKGFNVTTLSQDVRKGFMQTEEHILRALYALPKNSIIITCVSNKFGRLGKTKSFRHFCQQRGHRFLSATGLGDVSTNHFDFFLEALNVNYGRMKKTGLGIKKLWDEAKEIRVKTALGTDITFNIEHMNAVANIGEYHDPGMGGNMPAGEVYIAPRGTTNVNGIVVIDGSIKTESGAKLVEEPLTLFIENGRVVRMEGKHAPLLELTFQKFEDRAEFPDRIRLASEVGMGINPGAVLIGSTILDEKVLGTAHIALGSNAWFGGEIKTIFHGDMVFKAPEFYLDGKKMEM